MRLAKELAANNPQRVLLQEGLAEAHKHLSKVYKKLGKAQEAAGHREHWRRLVTTLIQQYPDIPKYRQWLQDEP